MCGEIEDPPPSTMGFGWRVTTISLPDWMKYLHSS